MKDKFIDSTSEKILSEARNNERTFGHPLNVVNGEENEEKRQKGALFIFDVMYARGYFTKAKSEVGENYSEIIEKMIDNSKIIVGDRGVRL